MKKAVAIFFLFVLAFVNCKAQTDKRISEEIPLYKLHGSEWWTIQLGSQNFRISSNVVYSWVDSILSAKGKVKGTGKPNRVAFWAKTDSLANDSAFIWDAANNTLMISDSGGTNQLFMKVDAKNKIIKFGYANTSFYLDNIFTKFPQTQGAAGTSIVNNGSGVWSWQPKGDVDSLHMNGTNDSLIVVLANGVTYALPAGSGSGGAAGSNTEVQFNNAGSFGASSDFTFDNGTFTVGDVTGLVFNLDNPNNGFTIKSAIVDGVGIYLKYFTDPAYYESLATCVANGGTFVHMDNSDPHAVVGANGFYGGVIGNDYYITTLAGAGTKMVTTDNNGKLSTQTIPAGTVTSVAATAPSAGFTISGSPILSSGTFTFTLANDLAALEGLSGTGFAKRTGVDTWSLSSTIGNSDLTFSSFTLNGNSISLGGSKTLTLASSDFSNQGTTTTVLHGNAAGNTSWSAVSLSADVTGTLDTTNSNSVAKLVDGINTQAVQVSAKDWKVNVSSFPFSSLSGTPTTIAGYGITDGIIGSGAGSQVAYFTSAIGGTTITSDAENTYGSGNQTLGSNLGNNGSLTLMGSSSGSVTLTTSAVAGTTTIKFPTTAGSSGNLLTSNGAGNAWGWTSVSTQAINNNSATNIATTQYADSVGKWRFYTKTATATTVAETAGNVIFHMDCTSNVDTLKLPTAVNNSAAYTVMKYDSGANKVVIKPAGSETINGQTSCWLLYQYTSVNIYSNGTNWYLR